MLAAYALGSWYVENPNGYYLRGYFSSAVVIRFSLSALPFALAWVARFFLSGKWSETGQPFCFLFVEKILWSLVQERPAMKGAIAIHHYGAVPLAAESTGRHAVDY